MVKVKTQKTLQAIPTRFNTDVKDDTITGLLASALYKIKVPGNFIQSGVYIKDLYIYPLYSQRSKCSLNDKLIYIILLLHVY
jgi:hypothetical protein